MFRPTTFNTYELNKNYIKQDKTSYLWDEEYQFLNTEEFHSDIIDVKNKIEQLIKKDARMKKSSKKHANMKFEEIYIKITPDNNGYIITQYSFDDHDLMFYNIFHDAYLDEDDVADDKMHTENQASKLSEQYKNSFKKVDYIFKPTPEMKNINLDCDFSEKDLEIYLCNNIEIIEEGMKFIDCQYTVDNGFIDILAKDKNNKICIIELKVKHDDSRLIEQAVYYPTQFKESVRMITICPEYSNKNYKSLTSLKSVELKQYFSKGGKIVIKDYVR